MWRGIFALFFRSLRCDARAFWVHLIWCFLLLVIYGAMCIAQSQSIFFGAPGLRLFQYTTYCNVAFISLLGISYFSSVISEEKEEDTLGLMTMAGMNPLGILLGKSTTRLFQVFLLMALQYPFTLLAITLGGLTRDQIYATYAAVLAYTVFLANLGLFCSVISRNSRNAAGLTTLFMVGYVFGPLIALSFSVELQNRIQIGQLSGGPWEEGAIYVLQQMFAMSLFTQLTELTSLDYAPRWTPQLISNLIGGVSLFLISWALFGVFAHTTQQESTSRAMVPKRTGRWRWLSAGRTWHFALAWKDFHFIAGGWTGILVRCILFSGLYGLIVVSNYDWKYGTGWNNLRWHDVTWAYQMFAVPLLTIDVALCMSRLFQEEIRLQTLAALLMLPRTVLHVFYSKLIGSLLGIVPGVVAVTIAFTLLQGSQLAWRDMRQPGGWWLIANLFLFVHLAAVLSLYLRWGAFAAALALTLGSMVLTVMLIELTVARSLQNPDSFVAVLTVGVVTACAACHLLVLLRLPVLGER